MEFPGNGLGVLFVCVSVFTLIAAGWDIAQRRIPNALTMPFLILGFVYQGYFHGWSGIGDGLLGLLVGAGPLLVLWLIGGGGGGDVKLMAALSVWLGYRLALLALGASVVWVILLSLGASIWTVLTQGSVKKLLPDRKYSSGKKPRRQRKPTIEERQKRRLLPFAIPVAIATWSIVAWKWTMLAQAAQ